MAADNSNGYVPNDDAYNNLTVSNVTAVAGTISAYDTNASVKATTRLTETNVIQVGGRDSDAFITDEEIQLWSSAYAGLSIRSADVVSMTQPDGVSVAESYAVMDNATTDNAGSLPFDLILGEDGDWWSVSEDGYYNVSFAVGCRYVNCSGGGGTLLRILALSSFLLSSKPLTETVDVTDAVMSGTISGTVQLAKNTPYQIFTQFNSPSVSFDEVVMNTNHYNRFSITRLL